MIEIQETSWYSDRLGREMPVKRYGTKGKPCLVIPSQDGKHNDFESFGMVEACRPFIENGRLQLFCVDTIDAETWSCTWKNPETGSSCMKMDAISVLRSTSLYETGCSRTIIHDHGMQHGRISCS